MCYTYIKLVCFSPDFDETMTTTTSPISIKIRWKTKKCERMCIHHYSERKPLLIHFLDFCLQISQQLEVEYHRCTQGWWRSLCLPNIIISTKDFGDISQCQRLKISDFSYFFTYLLINIKSLLIAFFSFLYYFSWFGSITTIRSSE